MIVIPEAEIIHVGDDQGYIRVVPRVPLDHAIQLICFQEETYSLSIDMGDQERFLRVGDQMDNLIGLIRQNSNGYIFHLTENPEIRFKDPDVIIGESLSKNPIGYSESTREHTTTPGITPTVTASITQTPTRTIKPSPTIIPTATIIPSPTLYPITLLISEFLPNPFGAEPAGEWIEIYNTGEERLLLDGIKIGDEVSPAGKEGMLRFPDGYYLDGGEVLVIANQADNFKDQYSFLPDFELVDSISGVPNLVPYSQWGRSTVKLSNEGDEVLLVDPWNQILDLVEYGMGSGVFSPPVEAPREGHSLERYPPERDEDQAEDWREKDLPSPGRLDLTPPTLVATQTSNPSLTLTESFTPTLSTPLSTLNSVTPSLIPSLTPSGTSLSTVTPTPSMTLSIISSSTVTETIHTELSVTPELTNSATFTITVSPTKTFEPSATQSPGPVTNTPLPTTDIPSVPTETSTPKFTSTSVGTPSVTADPVIIINEIHADPDPVRGDSNQDGVVSSDDDEFLEIVNISDRVLDLSGWQVYDEIRLRYTFPGGTSLSPGCGLVLFGGGKPSGEFGGSLIFTAGSLGLNNTGDLVILLGSNGVEMGAVRYGPEGNKNQSLTRYPDLFGPLPLVMHSQVPGAGSAIYSPGTKTDSTVFGSCP
jgi:hypothetical protein